MNVAMPCQTLRPISGTSNSAFKGCPDPLANLVGQIGGDSISDLVVLLGPVTHEEVVVREGLNPGGLTHRKATCLF